MKRRDSKGSHLGYYAHYVVDGGKARVILNVLVTPFEVTENAPMVDLLWRSTFRWKLRPRQVTGDTAYGTTENIAAIERAGIRAYVPLTGVGKARPYFSKEEFAYDPQRGSLHLSGRATTAPAGEQQGQASDRLQGEDRNLRAGRAEAEMHGQQDGPTGAAVLRRALRRSGPLLPRDLSLRKGVAQEAGVGGAAVRGGQRPTRPEEVQAQEVGEGERRGLD